ncbi:hypothetical protein DBV15_07087 [Temnothorax longispinosus]|uniref:Uncharacterized protein n=1 Tax=Temnothorax longispinosus TaxID=300112 RepID=A0A4S2KWW1_9HYME|nr:hypothetical protein DBV15_07087 [Temnothorax longispinosus]
MANNSKHESQRRTLISIGCCTCISILTFWSRYQLDSWAIRAAPGTPRLKSHYKAYGTEVYIVHAKEERERGGREERPRSKGLKPERPADGYGALVARRGSRSFVAPTVEPFRPLRLSRRMKYTSMENGPRSWRRIDRDFRAPDLLACSRCIQPLSYNAPRRKHTRTRRDDSRFINKIFVDVGARVGGGLTKITPWSTSPSFEVTPIMVIVFRRVTSVHNKPRPFFLFGSSHEWIVISWQQQHGARTVPRLPLLPIVAVPRNRPDSDAVQRRREIAVALRPSGLSARNSSFFVNTALKKVSRGPDMTVPKAFMNKRWAPGISRKIRLRNDIPRDPFTVVKSPGSRGIAHCHLPRTPESIGIAAEAVNEASPRGNYPPQLAIAANCVLSRTPRFFREADDRSRPSYQFLFSSFLANAPFRATIISYAVSPDAVTGSNRFPADRRIEEPFTLEKIVGPRINSFHTAHTARLIAMLSDLLSIAEAACHPVHARARLWNFNSVEMRFKRVTRTNSKASNKGNWNLLNAPKVQSSRLKSSRGKGRRVGFAASIWIARLHARAIRTQQVTRGRPPLHIAVVPLRPNPDARRRLGSCHAVVLKELPRALFSREQSRLNPSLKSRRVIRRQVVSKAVASRPPEAAPRRRQLTGNLISMAIYSHVGPSRAGPGRAGPVARTPVAFDRRAVAPFDLLAKIQAPEIRITHQELRRMANRRFEFDSNFNLFDLRLSSASFVSFYCQLNPQFVILDLQYMKRERKRIENKCERLGRDSDLFEVRSASQTDRFIDKCNKIDNVYPRFVDQQLYRETLNAPAGVCKKRERERKRELGLAYPGSRAEEEASIGEHRDLSEGEKKERKRERETEKDLRVSAPPWPPPPPPFAAPWRPQGAVAHFPADNNDDDVRPTLDGSSARDVRRDRSLETDKPSEKWALGTYASFRNTRQNNRFDTAVHSQRVKARVIRLNTKDFSSLSSLRLSILFIAPQDQIKASTARRSGSSAQAWSRPSSIAISLAPRRRSAFFVGRAEDARRRRPTIDAPPPKPRRRRPKASGLRLAARRGALYVTKMAALSANTGGCKYGLWLGLGVLAARCLGGEYSRSCVTRSTLGSCCLPTAAEKELAKSAKNVGRRPSARENRSRMRTARATRETIGPGPRAARLLPHRCLTRLPFVSSPRSPSPFPPRVRSRKRDGTDRRVAPRVAAKGSSPGAPYIVTLFATTSRKHP